MYYLITRFCLPQVVLQGLAIVFHLLQKNILREIALVQSTKYTQEENDKFSALKNLDHLGVARCGLFWFWFVTTMCDGSR